MTNGAPYRTQNKRSSSIKSSEILFGHDRFIHIAFKKSYCWKLHDMYRSFVGSKWKEANVTIWLNAYGHFRSPATKQKTQFIGLFSLQKLDCNRQRLWCIHTHWCVLIFFIRNWIFTMKRTKMKKKTAQNQVDLRRGQFSKVVFVVVVLYF